MSSNNIFAAEIEQAIIQKQAMMASLSNPDMDQNQKSITLSKINDINVFLEKFYNSINQGNETLNAQQVSIEEQSLNKKIESLQKALNTQTKQNQLLQSQHQNNGKNTTNTTFDKTSTSQKLTNTINQGFDQTYNNLSEKIIENTASITGASPRTLRDYLYLGWDYLVRDRLPKLLSTRLFLVVGGGYITERLGEDTTLKIVSIVLLVVFYIISEIVVKMSANPRNNLRFY